MLVLAIVYYNNRYPFKIYFKNFLNQVGYNYYKIDNYYKIVVSNYKNKLPLIFTKRQLLVDIFISVDILARNFEPIFDEGSQKSLNSLPVNMGGVKDIYENMHKYHFIGIQSKLKYMRVVGPR